MQFSVLAVFLVGLVVITNGFEFQVVRDSFTKFLAPYHASSGRHQRQADSAQCDAAIQEYQGDRFQQCYGAVAKAEENDVTSDDMDAYCADDCTSYLIDVSTKLAKYCNPSVSCSSYLIGLATRVHAGIMGQRV